MYVAIGIINPWDVSKKAVEENAFYDADVLVVNHPLLLLNSLWLLAGKCTSAIVHHFFL